MKHTLPLALRVTHTPSYISHSLTHTDTNTRTTLPTLLLLSYTHSLSQHISHSPTSAHSLKHSFTLILSLALSHTHTHSLFLLLSFKAYITHASPQTKYLNSVCLKSLFFDSSIELQHLRWRNRDSSELRNRNRDRDRWNGWMKPGRKKIVSTHQPKLFCRVQPTQRSSSRDCRHNREFRELVSSRLRPVPLKAAGSVYGPLIKGPNS